MCYFQTLHRNELADEDKPPQTTIKNLKTIPPDASIVTLSYKNTHVVIYCVVLHHTSRMSSIRYFYINIPGTYPIIPGDLQLSFPPLSSGVCIPHVTSYPRGQNGRKIADDSFSNFVSEIG